MKQRIEIQLFAPIVTFSGLHSITHLELEQYETYLKMGFRNRFQILSAGGVLNLSIPIIGGRDKTRKTWAVEIDYSGKWHTQHWRTLESAYNRSPFFEYYAPSLKDVWNTRPQMLWQFCLASMEWSFRQLKWKGEISLTTGFEKILPPGILDLRNKILPKNRETFVLPEYQQQFGNRFESNLSVLDLLFNCGPQAAAYLNYLSHPLNFQA